MQYTEQRSDLAVAMPSSEIDRIAAEHDQLKATVQAVCDACASGASKAERATVFDRLRACARNHFESEQASMRENGYPFAASHGKSHRNLTQVLDDIGDALVNGTLAFDERLSALLFHWVCDHIDAVDGPYEQFLRERDSSNP